MSTGSDRRYYVVSIFLHLVVILALALSFNFATPLIVIENTNKNDVISAVVLGDTIKSKLLPQKQASQPVVEKKQEIAKEEPIPKPKPVPVKQAQPKQPIVKKEAIALKAPIKKQKLDFHPDDLLADIKKQTKKQKQLTKKQLQAQFAKTLRQQAEKSMRQNLLNEDIKLTGSELRQAQGIVNKYQALVKQAISEHWVIPPQINKKLSCTLRIRTAPGGEVLDVQITHSSGDSSLDSSARAAVMKSSPLPVPSDRANYEPFKQFELVMKPEIYI